MATNTDSPDSLLCRLNIHTYLEERNLCGDVFVTEKTCIRCGKYFLKDPTPLSNPSQ